ncbi:hypothetical protein HPB51_006655 [Rhipicephalus microplus]|uniref:BTB domain-containing protein n=1 Tax=Rhipicephalus microplus TaxID=6941 RepID=A0A9J6E6W7_RHIMP|nr:uncharacterized protein LOC119165156 [Rhipicephalus microplus]KAH8030223.1 hypothetical protein HPB51_006655 [Rhipicephalus microplus]
MASETIPSGEPDVVVCIKGSEFLAHKEILMAASPYLRDILHEIGTEQRIKVELEGVSPSAFEALRSYMYLGSIRITCQNVTDVYRCAYKLRIRALISKCLQYLAESGEVGRHVVLYVNAVKVAMKDEEKVAFQFLVEHFDNVMRCREFLDLTAAELCSILRSDELGTRNELNVYVAALTWLDHEYDKRRSLEEQVLECVRFPLMQDATLMRCFSPPICPSAAVNANVKLSIVKAIFLHMAIEKNREDLVHEYRARPRTYLAEDGPAIDWDEKGVVRNFEKCSYTRENQALRHDAATCIQDAYRRHRGWPLHSSLPKLDSEMGAADAPCAEFVPTWVDSSESLSTKVRRDASQDMQIDFTPYEAKFEQVTRCQAWARRFLALRQYKRVHARVRPVVELEAVLDEDDPYQHFLVRHPGSRSIPPVTWDTYPSRTLPWHQGPLQDPDCAVVLLLGGVEPGKSHELATGCALLRYHPTKRELSRCGRLPQPRHNHTAAFLDGYVYLVGGFDMRNTHLAIKYATRSCFRMALEETGAGKWERVADMNHARCNHATVAMGHKLYVVAGQDEFDRFLASVEIYDPTQDQWSECPVPLCCKMSALGAAYHAGYLHIAGGVIQSRRRTDKVFLVPSVEHWDSVCQRWLREATQLPSGRGSLALVSYMDQLFAVGGLTRGEDCLLDVTADVLWYDAKKGVWHTAAPLPQPRHSACVVNADDVILLFGGLVNANQTEASADVLTYGMRQDVWEQAAKLPCSMTGFAAVVLPRLKRSTSPVTTH